MLYRPGFVTNSSSTGYYFFIPQDKEIYPDFFDEIGLTPIAGDGETGTVTKVELYRDFTAAEKERQEYLAELEERGDQEEIDWQTREHSIETLQETVGSEIKWMKKDIEDEKRRLAALKEKHPDHDWEADRGWTMSHYMRRCIRGNSKLISALKQGYRIVHIEYADENGDYQAFMDYHGGNGDILEKKGVGGVVTLSHH
jgi:hypothetical protein